MSGTRPQREGAAMGEVRITALDSDTFWVEVDEGGSTSEHRVTVPAGFLSDRGLDGVDPETAVRESMRFLLEREPASAILARFGLDDIPRYFPDYDEEIRARLSS